MDAEGQLDHGAEGLRGGFEDALGHPQSEFLFDFLQERAFVGVVDLEIVEPAAHDALEPGQAFFFIESGGFLQAAGDAVLQPVDFVEELMHVGEKNVIASAPDAAFDAGDGFLMRLSAAVGVAAIEECRLEDGFEHGAQGFEKHAVAHADPSRNPPRMPAKPRFAHFAGIVPSRKGNFARAATGAPLSSRASQTTSY